MVNYRFKIYDENFSNFIAFNKLLINSDLFNLGNYQVGNYIKLEKFSNTYFIVIYFDQYKQKVIPIKSFDGENLTLYGLDYINPYLEFIAKKF